MDKKHIIKSLTLEINNVIILLNDCKEGSPEASELTEKKARMESAVEVIKELPPSCKLCKDKGYKPNCEGVIMPCPDCNPYGVMY